MAVRNPSYIIEIETHLTDIKDQIKKYETDLQRLQKTTKDMGFGENISKDIQEAIDKLNKLQSEYIESVKKFSEAKLDTGEFDKFTKSFDSQMETISARMADTEKSISELSQKLSSFKGGDALQKQVEGMRRQMKNFMSDIKGSITMLKDFQLMVGKSLGSEELKAIAKAYKGLDNLDLLNFKGIDDAKDQLDSIQEKLADTYQDFLELREVMNDKNASPTILKDAEIKMANLLPKLSQLIKTVAKINKISSNDLFESGYSFDSTFGQFNLDDAVMEIDNETNRIKEVLSDRSQEIQKQIETIGGASTKASSFTFKDGGITIPVILDPNSKDFLENETKKLVEGLNKYAQSNPVDVVFRLFPMSGTRNEENNLAKTIKDIRAQIPKTEDKELQGQLDSFVNNLESQYRQAIKVRIAVELSETADDVVADIEKIREAARKANITISPHFEVSEEESANLKKQLEKVQDDFSFDATKKITAMSESLNKLLSTTNIKDWSEAFTKALEQVANKLEPMRDLIQPLADLTVSQKIKNGRGRPSKETVENRSYVESFYSALNALNKALAEKKKIESNTKELIPDIQSDIDKSGKSVLIPVKPNVKGFVEEIQDAINKEGVSVNVGQVSSNSGGINPIRPIDNSSISKESSTKNDTQESKSQVQDIKDAVVAKEEKNKVSEEELELQKEFNEVLDKYIQLSIEHERAMVAKKDKRAGQLNMSKWQLIEAYPELKAFDYHDTSKLTRENLFSGYYKRKTGKTRDIHNYSWDSQYEYVQNLIKKRGKFSVSGKENADNKKALEEYVNWFRRYQENGGTKPLIGLTKDKRIQKNLEKEYERQSKAIEKNTTKIKENEDIKKDIVDNSPTIKKETIEIEENNKKKEENIQIVKEGESGDNKNQADAQKLLDNLLAEANARNKVAEAAKEEAKEINNSNQEKNNNNVNWEDTFDLWKKHVKDNGGFNLRTKDGKKKLNHAVNAYMQYKANNGTRDITELSDDKATQEKLKKAYDDATSSIKKQAETKKENINSTEGLIQKHNELKQKMNEFQNQALNGDKDAVQKMVDTSKEIMEVRDKLEESGLIWSESESKFIQVKEQGREVGEAIVNGLKEQVPKIEEAGKEAGSAGAEGAAEGTAETQKSKSPSKVAEALGGEWGQGYANGILKSKEEVEAAVRDLVTSGKMTAEEIIKDLPNIGSEEKYKDLLEPVTKVGSEMLNYKPDKKTISSLKGQITKIGNQIANDPNIDTQKYAELAKRAEEYVNRLKRLRVETSEIEQKFKDTTEATYQKFKPIDTSESVEAVDKEAEKLEEIPESAKKASKSKEEFADANKQVLSSIVESLKGLDAEGNGFANLNKLINNLGGKTGDEKLQKTVEGLKSIYGVLNQDVSDNALIKALTDLASKGTDLESLATVLKATKKQISTAKEEIDTSNQDNLKSIMESVDVSENARNYLSEYGEVVNLTQELKNGFIQVTSTVLAADDTFKRYTLTTKDGVEMTISKTEEHTTGLEKEINLYAKLLRAANRLKALDEPNPRSTDEVFIEKDSALWNDVLKYAKEYGEDLGNILSITRSVREANGEMLESFKIVGENGSITIGAENDVVGSIQKIQDVTKQYKELLDLRNKLSSTDLKNTQKESFTPEYISQIQEMINLIDSAEFDLTNPADVARLEKMVADAKELDVASKNMDNTLGNMKQLDKLRGKIADILNDYGAMPRELKDNFNSLKSTVEYFINAGRISSAQADEINAKFLELNANLSESGKKYQSLGRQMLERLRSQSSQLLAQYFSFQDFIRYGRTAVSTIIDLDTQLVDLRKTTKMNNDELEEFYYNAVDIAKEMGVTTSEIISQASAWSRLGFNTKEASTQMAEISSKFASISPGMDTESSSDYLVSTIQAYGLKTDEVERKVLDNVNAVGNAFATTNAEIGEMLTRSSAAMKEANNSLEETIALETAAVEITRNAERTGTAFRTVSMRIRGYDEEGEDGELLEDYEELKGKIADLTKTAKTPGGISLFTDETKQTYKSTYQLLKEISEIYHDLTDKEQAGLLEALAGKRGGQVLAPILSDFSQVNKAMETMEGAAGSADREMDIIRDSIEYKLNSIKQTWVGVLQDVVDRGGVKNILDFIGNISKGLGGIVSNLGLVKTAIIGITTVIGSKKLGLFNTKDSGTLLGAIAQTHNTKKELSGYEDDIDTYKKVIEHLQQSSDSKAFFNMDIDSMENTSDRVKEKLKEIKDITDETKDSSSDIIECINDEIGNVETSIDETSKKTTTLGNSIKGFFKGLLNGLISMGASMLLSWGISEGIKAIDKLINKSKYIQQAAKKARDAISSIKTELDNTSKSVDETKQRYAELAQEVNHLGTVAQSQGTLSNDEYKEFLDLSNQLSKLFPTLTQGYDDNGNAILNLSGDVDTIVGSLENLIEVERQAANQKIAEELPADWAGYADDVDKYENKITSVQTKIANIQSILNGKAVRVSSDSNSAYDMLLEASRVSGVTLPTDTKYDGYDAYQVADLSSLEPEQMKKLRDTLVSMANSYENELSRYEGTIKEKTIDMYNNISTQILSGDYYDSLSEEMQKIYQGLAFNYDYKSLAKNKSDKNDYDEVQRQIEAEIQSIINAVKDDPKKFELFQEYYNELFSIDTSEGVFVENIEKIKDYIQKLADLLDVKYIDLANIFGFGDIDTDVNKVKDAFIRSESTGKTVFDENLGYAVYDNNTDAGKAENEAYNQYVNFVDSLSKEDFDFWKNALDNGEIPQDVLHNGEAALKEYLKKLQEVTKKNPIEIKASAAVDSMASAKQAINSLDELYNQVVKMEEKDGQVTGFADPTLINNVESGFKDFIKEASESGKDVTQLNSALEEFERIMIEQPNDAEAASKAMDDLITAYIDQTDIIKNLTEENAEWSIKQLEIMGIENAEEVVMTRLSKASKKVSEAISKLNGVLVENAKVLKESKKGSDEYIKALESIKDSLKNALSIYDKDGEATFTPEINDEFVERYLDDINKMADGDVEALNKVRQAAAKEAFLRVNVSIPTEVAEMQAGQLMDIIGQVEDRNIEVGAYIDNAPFLDSLAEMMRSSDQTADAVAAAFQSMGYEVEWVPRPYTVEYVKANQSNIKDTKAYQAMLETAKAKVDVPALRIKRSGSAGAGAHYTGGSSSSSDSSSGGGGGGSEPTQPKDDTEETFDWIEVAIQRIEEEIARLDKIVENSYTSWSNRNTALVDEINKTVDAIKAQELAEEEYYRNANELQVNDGKGLNDDDYGENDYLVKEHDQKLLDEARAIWATGEYQEKVKHGLLTGDDIEKIQNKYLVETIKTYQEWINKGIAAGDAADDLRIKLGDLARTRFDHVKDEYDELIAFVTGSADIIDEKINRTEKKGYFVDKAYYHDLMALEEENYNYLAKKRDEMIKKRDEAVAAGYIEENSSEWNKMSQEIDGVTLAIEQSETKMVEYNNTLRQLDWDMFDWIEDRISRINSEAAFLVDLMSEERLVDDNGVFTAQGEATNAMYAVKYETYMRQARDYAEERKKIEADLINDPGNKELIKRREELIDLEQESIKNAQQEKEAIKSLVQEAINKQIEAMQKLVDEYKKSLQEARDLFTYQQNIQKQTENIANLRKQLAAYAGDDSEENRARVQKLQQQLEEAEQQLQETEWDKYISETEKFLDDMMDDYSETLNKKLEDIDSLIEEMIQHANNNADTVAQTIQDETDKVGYTLTDEFSNIISGGRDQMVTDLQSAADNITTAITNVQAVIESIKEYVAEMAEYGKKTEEVESSGGSSKSDSDSGSDKKSDDSKKSDGGKKSDEGKKDEGSKGSGTNRKLTDKDYYGVALAIINGNYGWGTGGDMDSKLKAKGFDVNRVRDIINKLYAEGYVHSGAWVGRYQGITDLSPYAFNKYAKGSKRILNDQLAWTQEKGQELIFRSSDGAMLTPLNTGDKVFTAQMTDNLWNLAKGRFTTNIPKSAGGNTINNSNAISITLPNVKNYEEFKTALQNDPKMTSFIQQITLGEISNGIKLNKKKY